MSCNASPKDIEWNNPKNPIPVQGEGAFAVYMFRGKKLKLLKSSESLEISLEPFNYELLTASPVTILPRKSVQFAPIGLVNMLNSGGAIQSLGFDENTVRIGVRGAGEMRVYSSEEPRSCRIGGVGVKFKYEEKMVRIEVPWLDSSSSELSVVEYEF